MNMKVETEENTVAIPMAEGQQVKKLACMNLVESGRSIGSNPTP
jgi:hypothetical protein